MNSIIACNINNGTAISQQIASGSRTSLLLTSIEFTATESKTNFSLPNHQGKSFVKLGGKDELFNGQKKAKDCLDQNKNSLGNSYLTLNGNKEKVSDEGIPTPKVQLYTGKIHVEWKQVYKIGAGLNNLGNTCFMNTVIQCLTYCPPLANYLLHDNDHPSKCTITGFCMMCLLQKHMKRAIGKSGDVIKPTDVYQRLKLIAKHFQFGRQEDAHEFLRYVIDNLWKSCLSQNNGLTKLDPASKETTVINQIFGGYHRSQVTCLRCKEKSNTFDHFMDFILDIKQNVLSLEKALEKFTQPELLQQENLYKCPKCKMKVSAQKRFSVYRPPNVATFQLKRFDYHRSFGGKITKQISYPEKLNLRPYMSETKGDPMWYRLNAVLVHSGPSCNAGHYYCYVKNSNGFWYIMDDQRVHQVSLNQVLNQSAYVLFYVKMETSEGSLKKCDNQNFLKGSISGSINPNHRKIPEISAARSSPLKEVIQTSTANSPAKVQMSPLSTNNKKISFPLSKGSDKISFGIRPSATNIQELRKSSGLLNITAKKIKQPIINSKVNNSRGLVPYVEDSSESSEESDRPVHSKAANFEQSSVNENKNCGAKENSKNNTHDDNFPCVDIRAKVSKSVSPNKCSVSNSVNSNSSPKVIATESWTVTDAVSDSPPLVLDSSSQGVNSTTDWHVISTEADSSVKPENLFSKENKNISNKENGFISSDKMPECTESCVSYSDYDSGSVHQSVRQVTTLSQGDTVISNELCDRPAEIVGESSSPTQKCNFRKQASENKNTFLENEKDSNRQKQSTSFLKRKCSDSYQKTSSDSSKFLLSESRRSPVPKKAKHSEELSKTVLENKVINPNFNSKSSVDDIDIHKSSDQSLVSSDIKYHKNPSSSKSTHHINGHPSSYNKLFRTFEKTNSGRKVESDSESISSSNSSGTTSSLEYEWVEKTKDSIDSDHSIVPKGKSKSVSTNSPMADNRKQNIVTELNKNSSFFYGTAVPTWKGEAHYRDSVTINENQKSFDNYDDEFDKGKVRKSKQNDRYHQFHKKNLFQKYANRYHGHSKFGKFHYSHHHHQKPYDSHAWKRNHSDRFHRNGKYYRHHFQR